MMVNRTADQAVGDIGSGIYNVRAALGLEFDSSDLVGTTWAARVSAVSSTLVTQIDWDLETNAHLTGGCLTSVRKVDMLRRSKPSAKPNEARELRGILRVVESPKDRHQVSNEEWELWADDEQDD